MPDAKPTFVRGRSPANAVRRLGKSPALARYSLAFAEQGLTALLSLGVSVWLIRNDTPASFGAYVFWSNTVLIAGTLAAGMTTVHLYRLPPGTAPGRIATERVTLSAALALTGLATLITAAAVPLLGPALGSWAAIIFVPGTLIGLYARAWAASRGALGLAAAVSAIVFAAVVAGLMAEYAASRQTGVTAVLLLAGAAQGVAGGWALARLAKGDRPRFGRHAQRRWRVLLRRSGWPMLGGLAGETTTRIYIFLVTAWGGAVALSALAAAQTVLRPATLLAGAWAAAARAPLARHLHAGDTSGFLRMVALGALGPAAVTLGLGLVLALGWPLVSTHLYGGRYPALGGVVMLWSVYMAIACFVLAGTVALQALRHLRQAAASDLIGALICAGTMPLLLWTLPPPAALVAMILGGGAQVAIQARAIHRALRLGRI